MVFNILKDITTYDLVYKNNNGPDKTFVKTTELYNDKNFKDIKIGAHIYVLNPMFSTKEYFVNYLYKIYKYVRDENGLCRDLLISNKYSLDKCNKILRKKNMI